MVEKAGNQPKGNWSLCLNCWRQQWRWLEKGMCRGLDKYLSEVERGVSKVSVEVLDKVASGLNVELRDLLSIDLDEDRKQMEEYLHKLIKGASDEQLVMLQRVVRTVLV